MTPTILAKLDEIRERVDALFKYNPFRVHDAAHAKGDFLRQGEALRVAVDGLILESCQFCPRCKGAKTDDFETCSASATIQQIAAIMNGEE